MRAVVDTMVFANALFRAPGFHREALSVLGAIETIVVPETCIAELGNVAWQWIRRHGVSLNEGIEVVANAERLISRVVPVQKLWPRALELAVYHDQSVYDTLFVSAAEIEGIQMVTYDKAVLRKFGGLAVSPTALLNP